MLLIHQGSNLKPIGGETGLIDILSSEPFHSTLYAAGYGDKPLPMGKIVAVCNLVDCRRTDEREALAKGGWFKSVSNTTMRFWELTDQEKAFGDYAPGRYAWLLADIRALPTPIAARGLPGLWDIELEEGALGV